MNIGIANFVFVSAILKEFKNCLFITICVVPKFLEDIFPIVPISVST